MYWANSITLSDADFPVRSCHVSKAISQTSRLQITTTVEMLTLHDVRPLTGNIVNCIQEGRRF